MQDIDAALQPDSLRQCIINIVDQTSQTSSSSSSAYSQEEHPQLCHLRRHTRRGADRQGTPAAATRTYTRTEGEQRSHCGGR